MIWYTLNLLERVIWSRKQRNCHSSGLGALQFRNYVAFQCEEMRSEEHITASPIRIRFKKKNLYKYVPIQITRRWTTNFHELMRFKNRPEQPAFDTMICLIRIYFENLHEYANFCIDGDEVVSKLWIYLAVNQSLHNQSEADMTFKIENKFYKKN